ncbi:acetyl-CoA carboxylase biotin carboxyl carrier protein subunit [Cytobacillus kochii]|uniref:acetyl-CoA carboxylase biotin carboxyl carrier protein subunit n=1 Tax=Cytobacillus kochii TaxID=859143 RepID=UPI002E1E9380|nr:acetyl-CoA carboxylase biotin carboxyl carrier protein subunit [Cytobacillus kochii]
MLWKHNKLNELGVIWMNVLTNMAGNVWKINIKQGDKVSIGQEVIILESMKMEIPVAAEIDGEVESIFVNEGDFINDGDVILKLK